MKIEKSFIIISADMKKIEDYKLIFMGTPTIAAKTFEELILAGFNFVALIAQEDKPVGRKNVLEPVPTKVVAQKYNIPVYQPHRIRKDYEFIKELEPDLILTMAYGQIVPQGVLDIPKYGCLNLHGSLLPKYRGAAPIQRAIMNGDKVSGITLMEMIDKMDAGRMYAFEKVDILDDDNYSSLCEKMSEAASKIVKDNLLNYFQGNLPGEIQDESLVTFADKISIDDEKIPLSLSCNEFINYVRGLADEPGGYILVDNKKIKIYKAHKINNNNTDLVGTISIKKGIFLQLNDGQISLDELKMEGKKRMDGKSFSNGAMFLNSHIAS